ncbi:lysine 2,3-aminomutase YodO family protein [Nitrosococcus halophilus Nc 4]|uniref:L-lysine 2,3-aminomutase n=1 Tax=Nitrosococcus halophilus (strain Nc4) TaxID=472759 RepID=D5BWB5_NITHN|nr:EF-P beta-lysylation protein EpmB [Nitrosococcus halophilus]ADE13765.1 lysine 2,3-aminomutase YodO family protein [Nitrosococcus halophilus Nc 4]
MITQSPPPLQRPAWQTELARAVRNPQELLALIGLNHHPQLAGEATRRQFPLRVPRGYIARMKKGDPNDPLFRQVFPLIAEDQISPGFSADPVGDLAAMPAPGVLQKYAGRVLLVTTGACAIHCRYCFRRHFPYADHNPAPSQWQQALQYIAQNPSTQEVILSGGDPLTLTDNRLTELVQALAAISHVKRLRIHTRLPVVLPERVDSHLLQWLEHTSLQKVVVIHANHANELDDRVGEALEGLSRAGCRLFNQTVLLRGINDRVSALCDLSESLFDAGVIPYYLHLLDRVQGAAHFEVDTPTAQCLHRTLRARLPGYLVPLLVQELAGAPSKLPLEG